MLSRVESLRPIARRSNIELIDLAQWQARIWCSRSSHDPWVVVVLLDIIHYVVVMNSQGSIQSSGAAWPTVVDSLD